MHRVADAVSAAVDIPLLHIADATAQVLARRTGQRIGLLGTAFTMELDFYKQTESGQIRYRGRRTGVTRSPNGARHHLPGTYAWARSTTIRARFISRSSIACAREKIDGVILGCTEIGMLITATAYRHQALRHHRDSRRAGGRDHGAGSIPAKFYPGRQFDGQIQRHARCKTARNRHRCRPRRAGVGRKPFGIFDPPCSSLPRQVPHCPPRQL